MTLDELLAAIEEHGSVRKAAAALGISAEAISSRFRGLDDTDELKVKYTELCGRKGRPRQYPEGVEGDRERSRKASQKYRQKSKKLN